MFNPLNKIYKLYGIDTDDLIYYLLSYDDIKGRYDLESTEYMYCMSELRDIILEDHDESFISKCNEFVNLCYGNNRLMNAITNREYEMMDVDKVMSAFPSSENDTIQIDTDKKSQTTNDYRCYKYPTANLLNTNINAKSCSREYLETLAKKIQNVLSYNGIQAYVTEVNIGPRVILYTLEVPDTTSVVNLKSCKQDLLLALAVKEIELVVPIPGTSNVGIKVLRNSPDTISLKEVITPRRKKYIVPIGMDELGNDITIDFNSIDNLLIAGTTGSGKSALIDSIISYVLMTMSPEDIKLILIDTHIIQLSLYNGIPHLLLPVVTDVKRVIGIIHWLIKEAHERIAAFTTIGVKDIYAYNSKIDDGELIDCHGTVLQKYVPIFCIVDDYADIVLQYPDAEEEFAKLCRVARMTGIHLIFAIQRPAANVIKGEVKANFKSRLSFKVTSALESRIVLDCKGAEDIYEHGVFLYRQAGRQGVIKGQSVLISEDEINNIVHFLKSQNEFENDTESATTKSENKIIDINKMDPLFPEAGRLIIESPKCSIGVIQKKLRIGFNRATRIMDQLADAGVVGPEHGIKSREVNMNISEFERLLINKLNSMDD